MRILVTGSRDHDPYAVAEVIKTWIGANVPVGEKVTIIHGLAKGADRGAHFAATELGTNEYRFPAEWEEYGTRAGPLRNLEMLETIPPDVVLAFPLGRSSGTKHMMRAAKKVGVPVVFYDMPGVADKLLRKKAGGGSR